jgi:hypothetical protein
VSSIPLHTSTKDGVFVAVFMLLASQCVCLLICFCFLDVLLDFLRFAARKIVCWGARDAAGAAQVKRFESE